MREVEKCYPLSHYKNKDILEYINRNGLIPPEKYGPKGQSNGQNISDLDYLLYIREKFPKDLQKIYDEYPDCERLLFEYDYKQKEKQEKKE